MELFLNSENSSCISINAVCPLACSFLSLAANLILFPDHQTIRHRYSAHPGPTPAPYHEDHGLCAAALSEEGQCRESGPGEELPGSFLAGVSETDDSGELSAEFTGWHFKNEELRWNLSFQSPLIAQVSSKYLHIYKTLVIPFYSFIGVSLTFEIIFKMYDLTSLVVIDLCTSVKVIKANSW